MRLKRWILTTAFLEGLSVLVVEIGGARALAPYFGTSLRVWTAQITATLLFLALGYGLGGRLSAKAKALSLPGVFWAAGGWLGLYPWLRTGVLKACASLPWLGAGSFLASALLFGLPLLCLGAVSPLLIQKLEEGQEGDRSGGRAAGSIFLTNTLGGLAGGWFTALVLVPHLSLRLSLGFTGIALVILGSLWAWPFKKQAAALGLPLLVVFLTASGPSPAWAVPLGRMEARVLHRQASGVGLIQVIDLQASGYSQALTLLIDGITQGGIDRRSGLTGYEFTEYLARLSWAYHPQAKRALLLGLGTGALATQLHRRGMEVDVAEIEPAMEMVARTYFGLPAEVRVHATDARAYLQREKAQWDVIILDAFAGENAPWYLMSQEGLETIQSHLAPGGRLLVNWITAPQGSPGLQRLEAGLLKVFGEARVYVEEPRETQPLVNACLVAGKGLVRTDKGYPGQAMEHVTERVVALLATDRGAAPGGRITTDDRSDLELEEAELRLAWRKAVLKSMGPELLGD